MFVAITTFQATFSEFDHNCLQYWAEHRTNELTACSLALAGLGDTPGMLILSLTTVVMLLSLKRKYDALTLAIIMISGSTTNALLKDLLQVPRPVGYEPLGPQRGFSYPSGHAQAAVAYFGTLSLMIRRWFVVVPALLMIAGICCCRVYLGVHRPSDVLAGMLLAVTVISLVTSLRDSKGAFSSER
jgi:undecaprenyl-diphosphatase